MDIGHIEYGEGGWGRWELTGTPIAMAKVEYSAKVFEGYICKMGSSPVLIKQVWAHEMNLQIVNSVYLNAMEWLATVEQQEACLTHWGQIPVY